MENSDEIKNRELFEWAYREAIRTVPDSLSRLNFPYHFKIQTR